MLPILINMVCFLVMLVIQALIVNGAHECFRGTCTKDYNTNVISYNGNIFYMLAPEYFERNKNKVWAAPLWGCVKCMASVWGALTYWPVVIYLFGFHWVEIPVFVADAFCLVYVNYFFYKR